MEWQGRRQSGNVVDRRGMKAAGGIGGVGIIVAIVYALMGGDPRVVLDQMSTGGGGVTEVGASGQRGVPPDGRADPGKEFASVVLADTEDVWREVFKEHGARYAEPKLVLFSRAVQSACGRASSSVGPFYCPGDSQVYLDLDFFRELSSGLGASGDFAQAYVIAHEVGHHVQNLLGVSGKFDEARRRMSERQANAMSVLVELQADCYAGVWAKRTQDEKQVLEDGDVEEALQAANAVGDDRLQKRSRGQVVPDSFTHGTSAQRMEWFTRGMRSGRIEDCDTFAAAR